MAIREILYPTDFSPPAQHAGQYAALIARRLGATVHLLHVPFVPLPSAQSATGSRAPVGGGAARRDAADRLDRLVRDAAFGGVRTRVSVDGVIAEDAIVEAAAESDLVVMGTHGRTGWSRMTLGSVTARVVATAPCPVLVVKQSVVEELPRGSTLPSHDTVATGPRLRRLLVPLDGSAAAETVLTDAVEVARAFDAVIILLHVLAPASGAMAWKQDTPLPDGLDAATYLGRHQRNLAATGLTVQRVLRVGDPATQILACGDARHADVIAMATHGHRGVRRWLLGSVTEDVLCKTNTPVLVRGARAAGRAWRPAGRDDETAREVLEAGSEPISARQAA